MTFKRKKVIGKNTYWYWEESVRMPDGKVKKISIIAKPEEKKANPELMNKKKADLMVGYALSHYAFQQPITESDVRKIEEMKMDYKRMLRKLTLEQRKDLFDRFTANFTYESNALEGNSLTLKDVEMVLFEKRAIKGKELREIYETRNSRKAMDQLLAKKIKINHESIIGLHSMLMKDIDMRKGYKLVPNFILGSTLNTVPPEKVHAEMTKLIAWYQNSKKTLHPIHIVTEFHGRFSEIHPFEDGNGRTGRFLINAILLEMGYPPMIIRRTSRIAYLNCLHAFDNGSHGQLTRFMLDKLKDTYTKFFEIYMEYI